MGHECKECTFVANIESIYISPENRRNATKKPTFLGKFTMPNWSDHAIFYFFKCLDPECGKVVIDYPHGYAKDGLRSGLIFIYCFHCKARLILDENHPEVYRAEGFPVPPSNQEALKEFQKLNKIIGGKSKSSSVIFILLSAFILLAVLFFLF